MEAKPRGTFIVYNVWQLLARSAKCATVPRELRRIDNVNWDYSLPRRGPRQVKIVDGLSNICTMLLGFDVLHFRTIRRFKTYQDAHRVNINLSTVKLFDGPIFETNILRVSHCSNHSPLACNSARPAETSASRSTRRHIALSIALSRAVARDRRSGAKAPV